MKTSTSQSDPSLALKTEVAGRTALMHAVESGRLSVVKAVADQIVKRGHFSVFLLKNEVSLASI